jgi:hypothetical protein
VPDSSAALNKEKEPSPEIRRSKKYWNCGEICVAVGKRKGFSELELHRMPLPRRVPSALLLLIAA